MGKRNVLLVDTRRANLANTQQHDFFESVAGNATGQPVAESIREALQAEAETIKQANIALPEKLTEHELAIANALKVQLIEAGIFKQSNSTEPKWLRRLASLFKFNFATQNWVAGFAVAASVMIICTIIIKQSVNDLGPSIKSDVATASGAPSAKYAQIERKNSETQDTLQSSTDAQSHLEMKETPTTNYAYNNNKNQKSVNIPQTTAEENTKSSNKTMPQSTEPDTSAIEEKTSIASNAENSHTDLKPDVNTQVGSEAKHQPSDEKSVIAENTPPRDISKIFRGEIAGLYSRDKLEKANNNDRRASTKSKIDSLPQNVFSILDTSPKKKADDLRDRFSAIGADVAISQSNDDEWIVDVSMPDPSRLGAIKKLMIDEGFHQKSIENGPPYKIIIKVK